MVATRLDIQGPETLNAKKSGTPTQLVSTQITSGTTPALTTTYIQIGNADGYDVGNNPSIAGHVDWIKGSGATLTLAAIVSIDGTTYTKLPVFAVPSSGVSAVSPGSLTYAVASWDDATLPAAGSGSANHNACAFEFRIGTYRYVKLFVKVDDATNGSIETTSAIWAGTLA